MYIMLLSLTWSVGLTAFGRSAGWNEIFSGRSNLPSVVRLSTGFTCLGRSVGMNFGFSGVIMSPSPVRRLSSCLIGERFSQGPKVTTKLIVILFSTLKIKD